MHIGADCVGIGLRIGLYIVTFSSGLVHLLTRMAHSSLSTVNLLYVAADCVAVREPHVKSASQERDIGFSVDPQYALERGIHGRPCCQRQLRLAAISGELSGGEVDFVGLGRYRIPRSHR